MRPSATHESPPFLAAHGYTPHFGWSSCVPPPISNELLMSPPHFQKCFLEMCFATFLHYWKRHYVIKFKVLCHWISVIWMTKSTNQLIWMVKTLKFSCTPPHSRSKCHIPPFLDKMCCLPLPQKNNRTPPLGVFLAHSLNSAKVLLTPAKAFIV